LKTAVEKLEILKRFKLESLKFKQSQLETIERNGKFFRSWKVRTEIGEFHWNLEALRLDPKLSFSQFFIEYSDCNGNFPTSVEPPNSWDPTSLVQISF